MEHGDAGATGPLSIAVAYDKTELSTNDVINVQVTVANNDPNERGMMMAELGLPPGFELDASALDAVLGRGQVARYEKTPLRLVVYLENLRPGAPAVFSYALRATEPLEASAPESEAYLYYNREVRAEVAPYLAGDALTIMGSHEARPSWIAMVAGCSLSCACDVAEVTLRRRATQPA